MRKHPGNRAKCDVHHSGLISSRELPNGEIRFELPDELLAIVDEWRLPRKAWELKITSEGFSRSTVPAARSRW
jgi:hypothetical protein